MNNAPPKQHPDLKEGLDLTLFVQGATLFITGTILDAGQLFNACLCAIVIHWIIAIIVWLRHRHSPTKLDLILFRGTYVFTIGVVLVLYFLPELRG